MTSRTVQQSLFVIAFTAMAYQTVFAQWQKTAGPPGMNVKVFYQRGNTLFAGTDANGVFKSTNNGISWVAANSGITDRNVFALIANGASLFAGTNNGVYRSDNNGATWQAANHGIEQKFVYSFAFGNGFLFAGTGGGMYKTADGINWSDANGNALTSSIIHDIVFTSPHLVAIADNLVFYSDDNGDSWFYNSRSPFVLGANPCFLARHDSVLLATASGVFRSFDGGVNWGNFIQVTPSDQGNIVGLVDWNNRIIAGTRDGIFYSANFGNTWKSMPANNIRHGNWFVNDFYKSGRNLLLAYDEIAVGYSADSGRQWNYTLQGFPPSASIDNATLFSNNTLFTGTHGDGVYTSSTAGNVWTKIGTTNNTDTLSNSNVYALLKINNIILAGTCGNGLYRSANNGATWVHITAGLPKQQNTGFLCVQSLAKTKNAVLIGTDQGLYYSLDSGLTWNTTNISNKNVVGIAAKDSIACAAVENIIGASAIYRSVNNASWNMVLQVNDADWTCMASDGRSHFYAGTLLTSNFVSNNNGLTWQTVGPDIPPGSGGYAIGALGNNVFIGNSQGMFYSNNNGLSFSQANTGFGNSHAVQGIAISSTDVYAGLFENSVWKRPLSDFGIMLQQNNTANKLPVSFMPNPLITESKIAYAIASAEKVTINIYSQNGNLAKQVINEIQEAGNYTAVISKDNLRPGSYFLVVVAGNKQGIVTMVVE